MEATGHFFDYRQPQRFVGMVIGIGTILVLYLVFAVPDWRDQSEEVFNTLISTDSKTHIAVCITGQPGRLQPYHLLNSLIKANRDFVFSLFYVLQVNSSTVYNTQSRAYFSPSVFSELSSEQLKLELMRLGKEAGAARVSVSLLEPMTPALWRARFNGSQLDRITQYKPTQHTILNMYRNQEHCLDMVKNTPGSKFEAVISTREDIFFFKAVNFTALWTQAISRDCALVAKNCLSWTGINMRFQLIRGMNVTSAFLGNRIAFYRSLYNSSAKLPINPEKFEAIQAASMKLKVCNVSVEDLPATAARHVSNGTFCLISWEAEKQNCYPQGMATFVKEKACIPNVTKPNPVAAVGNTTISSSVLQSQRSSTPLSRGKARRSGAIQLI